MTIYTGRGDEGQTDLGDGSQVAKTSPRIVAYGTVDELNAIIGTIRPSEHEGIEEVLAAIQNHLHVVQAELAMPGQDGKPMIEPHHVTRCEDWIDEFDEQLEPLDSFILPGGTDTGAKLHHARTVCRRAERAIVDFASDEPTKETMLQYCNRLSDLLFVLARTVNARAGIFEETPTY